MPVNPSNAIGIDIYEGNGAFIPSAAQHRIDFVIAQSNRALYKDTRFQENYRVCKLHGIPFMAYNQYQAIHDWKRQADVMLGQCAGLDVRAMWLAYDSAGGNRLTAKSAADAVNSMAYMRVNGDAHIVGVYGNRTDIKQLYTDAPAAKEFPLWLAQYPLNQTTWNNNPDMQPYFGREFPNGVDWMVWQYASEKNWLGFKTGKEYGLESWSVDINTWNGTTAKMRADLGYDVVPPPVSLTVEQRLERLEATMDDVRDMLGLA